MIEVAILIVCGAILFCAVLTMREAWAIADELSEIKAMLRKKERG